MYLLTNRELYNLSVIPKADLTIKIHFACKNLDRIIHHILGGK